MIRGLMSAGLVLFGTTWALAFGHGSSGPPTQQLVRIDSAGQLQVYYQVHFCVPETATRTVQRQVPVTKEVTEEVDGEVRTKKVTVYETYQEAQQYTVMKNVCETKVRTIEPAKVKAFETDGRPIPAEKLPARLKGDTLVLVSGNDEMVPDYIAGLFKQGTVVLVLEAPEPMVVEPVEGAPQPPPPGAGPQEPQAALEFAPIRTVSQVEAEEEEAVKLRVPDSAPAPVFPSTMPPMFVYASRNGAETIKLRQSNEYTFEMTGHIVKRQGTGKQMVPVQMSQTNRNTQITAISGKHLKFFAGDGNLIPADRAKEKLTREATVLYSADGDEVDSFWLQNLKPTTLVLVGPQLQGGCAPAPAYGGSYAAPMAVPAPQPPQAPAEPPAEPKSPEPKPAT